MFGCVIQRVKEPWRGTPIHHLYKRARAAYISTEEVMVTVEDVSFQLSVVGNTRFAENLQRTGIHEPLLSRELLNVLGPKDVFYDVGSKWGYFPLLAATQNLSPDRIFVFECDAFHLSILSENEQGRFTIVSEQLGTGEGGATLSLDTFVTENPPPDVVKIDTDGAEGDILDGAREMLRRHDPRLYVEVHPQFLPDSGYEVSDIHNMLRDCGYILDIADHRDSESTWRPFSNSTPPASSTYLLRAK